MVLFDAICGNCGAPGKVPFEPTPIEKGGRPVICRDCLTALRPSLRFDRGSMSDGPMPEASRPQEEQFFTKQAIGLPIFVIKSLIIIEDKTKEGELVQGVSVAWFAIINEFERHPEIIYELLPREWEEIIAGAYKHEGWDEVILTPRSADKGRDVVATKKGIGSIRFFDQVKAYAAHRPVSADEVRAMIGVITGAGNVSKGIITTTSCFAPRVVSDEYISPFLPYRLELRPCDVLLRWLSSLARGRT